MSDCCEKYPDFIAICSFLNIFGPQLEKKGETGKVPSIWTLKYWLEQGVGERAHRSTRNNPFNEFLLRLLANFKSNQEKDPQQLLIRFTLTQGMGKQSVWLRDYGFEMLCLKEKLAILRRLLEYQLDRNKTIFDSASVSKGSDIRHEPLGRDCKGNFYWQFYENRYNFVVKEIVNSKSEPLCVKLINQESVENLLDHVKKAGRWQKKDDKLDVKVEKGKKRKLDVELACGKCRKKFKPNQVTDEALRFDNSDWFCPNCEQKQLIEAIKENFLPDEE